MHLRVEHHTTYHYQSAVVQAQHLGHLQPRSWPHQQVQSHSLRVLPEPAVIDSVLDSFGNWRVQFSLQTPHDTLHVQATSVIDTLGQPCITLPVSPFWTEVREHHRYHAQAPYDPTTEFVFASPYVPISDTLADYARQDFDATTPWLQGCLLLMQRIHSEFTYASDSTEVNTPTLQAFEQKQGVCQDFAHIMVGCLRSLGLPARYVSGYLLTQPPPGQPRLIGADASHAWVSVPFVSVEGSSAAEAGPMLQWMDFDPTNNRWGLGVPGADYITLAVGRDFGDVSPLRGVIQGGGSHTLNVAVTVAPAFEFDMLASSPHNETTP